MTTSAATLDLVSRLEAVQARYAELAADPAVTAALAKINQTGPAKQQTRPIA